MHVVILCVAYLLRLPVVKTGGPLYLTFVTPTRSGKIMKVFCSMFLVFCECLVAQMQPLPSM